MDSLEEILAHHGIKGMKWGVRKDNSDFGVATRAKTQEVNLKIEPGKGVVKTSGGHGLHPSEDAIRTKTSHQKAKTSSLDSLSNKELQDLVNRMNLEEQYGRLTNNQSQGSRGEAFARQLLKDHGPTLTVMGLKKMAEHSGDPKAMIAVKMLEGLLRSSKGTKKKKK